MLTMSEPAAELVPDLPLSADALACVLEQVRDGSVLASAEAVNREWQATSAGVWPKVLAASFSLRRISDPRRRFAEEACWARGRAVRATLEAQPGIGGVCVSSGHVTCASLGSTPALSRLPLPAEVSLAPHEPRASRKFSATARLPAVACAAHDEGAAWCFEGNRMDLAFWSTTEATAGSVLRLETSPRGEVGPAPVTTVTALHACPLPGRDGRVQIVSGHAGGNVCLRVAKHSDATEAGTEGGVEVAVRAEGETGEACQAHAYPTASYSTAYGACTAVGCDATSLDGPVVVGWASGHVEAIDRERCQAVTSALSTCACPPLCLATDFDSGLLAITRRHHMRGSGHGHRVELFDLRRGLSSANRVKDLWPRRLVGESGNRVCQSSSACLGAPSSLKRPMPTAQQRESIRVMSATEEVVGVHVDGAKAVLCTSHGMVCAWDARSWQQTLSSFVVECPLTGRELC